MIHTVRDMQNWSEARRHGGRRIALVPTMGALHEGHLQLVRLGHTLADAVVVSIFVNPTQFGPQEDFAAYPRNLARDRELLEKEGVDAVFGPAVDEMYPNGFQTEVQLPKLGGLLCGAHRPGHFAAVATVVAKLFNITRPHFAVFGEKDYQQLQVIRAMVRDLNFPVEIAAHPIVREADGLAMSSRNAYLGPSERKAALCLTRSLRSAACLVAAGEARAGVIIEAVNAELTKEPLARPEYVKLCDAESLEEIERIHDQALLALAVRIGRTRLIDNRILKRQERDRFPSKLR